MVLCRSGSSDLVNVRYPFGLGLSRLGRSLTVRAEPVEAWASVLILRHACAEGGSRVVAPAGDSLFFASPKKSKQKKGDPQSATPSRCEGADLRRGGCGVRRRTHFAASQLRSNNCGESDYEARALRRACHPTTAPPQAQPEGLGSRTANSQTALRAIAALGPVCAARGACARETGAERSDGPCGCPPGSLHDAPRRAGRGAARARQRPCFVL